MSDNICHGYIYYDIEKDMIFFKNKQDIEFPLFSKNKNISFNSFDNHSLLFNGDWRKNNKYLCNNIVKYDELEIRTKMYLDLK